MTGKQEAPGGDTQGLGDELVQDRLARDGDSLRPLVEWKPDPRHVGFLSHPDHPGVLRVPSGLALREADISRVLEVVDPSADPPWYRHSDNDGDGRFNPQSLEWEKLKQEGLPEIEFLLDPYLPAEAKVWAAGPTESAKSMWAAWAVTRLTLAGRSVIYIQQENPLPEEARRWDRLRPDHSNLRIYHYQDFDLVKPEHVELLVERMVNLNDGAALVVFDTVSACWSGDENLNTELVALDRTFTEVIAATRASILVLDHTGHPQMGVPRRGAAAARGASAKGQKSDYFLEFRTRSDGREFLIHHGKARIGGVKQPDRAFLVVDTEDDGLDIEEITKPDEPAFDESAARARAISLVEAEPRYYSKSSLANAIGGRREDALGAVEGLLADGELGPRKPRAKLMRVSKQDQLG